MKPVARNGYEVVVITGASAGIGRATARKFAQHGAHIGLLARGLDGLEAAKREVEELGGKALIVQTDVAHAAQVESAAAQVEEALGPIDIWINNAMASVFSRFMDMTLEEFRRVTELTYLGTVNGTWAALQRMLPRNRGCIVQVGSALAYRSIPLQSAYCGAKHAIRGFTDSLRSELIHDRSNVHLTMVQLPGVNTPQFNWVKSHLPNQGKPVGPVYQPEIAAEAIYWAAHQRRREVFVGIPAVKAIVGNKIIPGALDHYLATAAVEGQQTSEPRDPNQPDNLWQPLPGDHGAHGRFDAQARKTSPQLWATKHRTWLGVIGAGNADWQQKIMPFRAKVFVAAAASAVLLFTMAGRAGQTDSGPQEKSSMKETIAEKIFHQTPQQIRQDLQQAKTSGLSRRRLIIVLSLAGIAAMTMVSLFQTGLIHHIPDLPNRSLFDSDKVNSSEQAYKFGVPDGTFVIVSLAITIVLAAFGGANRAEVHAWIPLVFTAKTAVDAFFSAAYLWNMVTVQKVACIYCIAAALMTFAIVILTLPEAKHAIEYVKTNHRAPIQTHA